MRRTTIYPIKDTGGLLVANHVRIDLPNGRKEVYWRRPGFDPKLGLAELGTPDLPLYGSEHIPSFVVGGTVILVEGEKPRDALWALGFDALGTVTGASATPGEDALSVLLPFDVVLWPDHDREGHRHMNRIAWELHRLGGRLPRAVVPEQVAEDGTAFHQILPKGFDAADVRPLADRANLVEKLIRAAGPWRLHREPPEAPRIARTSYPRMRDDGRVEAARANLLRVVEERLGPPQEVHQGTPWWRCPFHAERTPSFKVDVREPFYRCFGCPARGDVFTFLREMDGVAFKDALQELAPSVGIGGFPRLWA